MHTKSNKRESIIKYFDIKDFDIKVALELILKWKTRVWSKPLHFQQTNN